MFQRGHQSARQQTIDVEKNVQYPKTENGTGGEITKEINGTLHKQTSIFQWKDICYDIKIKKEERRILNHVDGWVKPGTLTALMVSTK